MFEISELMLFSMDGEIYTYKFKSGINYFKGKNSSGKTEFYSFIDFMFGSSEDIRKKPWYVDSLKKATMVFEIDNIKYCISRTREPNQNYLYYFGENEPDAIDLREYKDKLNSIFARDINLLRDIRNFTDEELTYRTFTMFNFLGEKRQGAIHDFLDKCSDVRYSVKLAPVLNFIFNNNLEKIYELQNELEVLLAELREIEMNAAKYDFVINQVNKNLQKLGGNIWYTGKNADDIRKFLITIKSMQNINKKKSERNIADLEVMYNNISEQIKIYENSLSDAKQFEKDNVNRKLLLSKLETLITENEGFNYLIDPLKNLLWQIDNTISFSNYVISDNTIKELRKQREELRSAMKRNDSRFEMYTLEEKSKSIAMIEDYLTTDVRNLDEELKEKRKRVKKIREELKLLQASDDTKKIKEISELITNLYYSAKDISSVVEDDMNQEGFKIQYIKRGNILQPMVTKAVDGETNIKKEVNYYIGSMARHTLIQLCGYLAFLNFLIRDNRYPLIPILVIDHISKPFDEKNCKAIGRVISEAYESIGKDNLQIFMFDNKQFESLSIEPSHFEDLVNQSKSGFNPFFVSFTTENESDEITDDL
ncbi:hypothetical protein MJA45_03930 [Paenibacillus aurantius]|uniref:Uncharacterized protein n=1 Tax=Paenibacillus aurantius TaxID=2918900 RepID=A0AA96LFB0_9BACL|nr:AAA family ATPase [Paenibacillus aurantius]WNQ12210.1 hypothetical protein MJA45_03930 [Paenibacillus aurantius]